MKNVAVIGSGNLGRRHLEALLKLEQPLNLHAVDNFAESLRLANEVNNLYNPEGKHSFYVTENISALPGELDFVIVATNATDRRKITEILLKQNNVRYMLLEKVLFQKINDYDDVESLINNSSTKVWVNCNMQTVPFYSDIKKMMCEKSGFHFSVSGGKWNLGCSAIHYLSLIAFLRGASDDFFIDGSGLEKGYTEAARKGFIEFGGMISGTAPRCVSFSISCNNNWYSPIIVNIQNKEIAVSIFENGSAYISSYEKNWEIEEIKFRIPYQSELTGNLFEELMATGNCGLPAFHDSSKLHKKLIEVFLKHLNKHTETETDTCTIT